MTVFGKVSALSFDADQTLWDFSGVYAKALDATVKAMIERGDVDATEVTAEKLHAVREEVVAKVRGRTHNLEEVRERSFALFLERNGHETPGAAAAELTALYMQVRFEAIELYPEVMSSLARLQSKFKLGLFTNGNTDPDRCGLPRVFDAEVFGPAHGFEKPDPRGFHLVANELGVSTSELMHIGDSADDVHGANAVGATSVFINRSGAPSPLAADAVFEIVDLVQLEALLGDSR